MNRLWLFLPLAVFSLLAGAAAYQLLQPRDETVHSALIGKPIPDFSLPGALPDRAAVDEAVFRDGQPKLLNLWASWCLPCVAEAPQLEQLQDEGATIVGVAIRDTPQDIERFLRLHGDPYAALVADDQSRLPLAMGSSGLPETFVIDGAGVVRYQHIGDIRPEHVPRLLAELRKAGR